MQTMGTCPLGRQARLAGESSLAVTKRGPALALQKNCGLAEIEAVPQSNAHI